MISPFQHIISNEESDWQDFLEKCLLIDIFSPVLKSFSDPGDIKVVVRYIAYAYSVHSDKIILGMDWQKNKQSIFEFIMAKPKANFYESLVLLKNPSVVESIHRWLDFQDNDTFRQLQVLKDLRMEMQISCLTDIKNAQLEINYDQKYRNAGYSLDLKQKIKDLESELVQNDIKMKDAVKEVKMAKNGFNIGPENFSK